MQKSILVAVLAVVFSSNLAYGAQMEVEILNGSSEIEPSFKFLRVVYIEDLQGGKLDNIITNGVVRFTADSENTDLSNLVSQISQSIADSGSSVRVTDVEINYQAMITKKINSATIEYNVEIIPTIADHVRFDGTSVIVDSKWRGFEITDPIIIHTEQHGGFDVNNPVSAIKALAPQAYEELKDVDVLSIPLIDASGILELPMSKWHYLFDPTAIQQSVIDIGYTGVLSSEYSMGECTIAIGVCDDRKWAETVSLDKQYTIRAVESRDDAVISIEGYTAIRKDSDDINVSPEPTKIEDVQGGFQTSVIYGMAGVGAVGAVIFFWFSSRKIKNEKNAGQTGIDPAALRVQETSYSSGSYKTNRGESYLASDIPESYKRYGSKQPI